ncbi:hypothetical protein Lsan_2155 [Legionella santicrucis]|uniref:Uncharacterized protein n=1 Tax=Legionella santicrucis TaxID=45074 RepID=A0A0W0YRP4_9GAMM|nr:hypothetical protein Lsan_2155 [Legionella santicrucis]
MISHIPVYFKHRDWGVVERYVKNQDKAIEWSNCVSSDTPWITTSGAFYVGFIYNIFKFNIT